MQLTSINPNTTKELGKVAVSTESEIKSAVTKAQESKQSWRDIGLKKRLEYLQEVHDALKERQDDIAKLDTKEMGFPISQCKDFNLGDGFGYFEWYLENAQKHLSPEVTYEDDNSIHTVHYEPKGVAAVIQPWNFPFCQWSWSAVPNLIVGNTVVYKPSEEVPLSAKLIEEIISATSLPSGVLNFIYGAGDTGGSLVNQDIDLIVFTGSINTGQKLYKIAAEKFIPALLELGGSAPGVVFQDANLNQAAEAIFWQRFANCGQTCDGLKRLIVHQAIADPLIKKLTQHIKDATIGDPLRESTVVGPLAAKRQLELLEAQVKDAIDKGAEIIIGGKRIDDQVGYYYHPTILTNITPDMRVWQEEVFGPVLPVATFENEKEAIELANDTIHGLGSYVYTKDKKRAQRVAEQIEAGMVSINGTNYVLPMNPFGGYKQSGLGRSHGKYGLHELCNIKVIAKDK